MIKKKINTSYQSALTWFEALNFDIHLVVVFKGFFLFKLGKPPEKDGGYIFPGQPHAAGFACPRFLARKSQVSENFNPAPSL